jgi:hypothetical protein
MLVYFHYLKTGTLEILFSDITKVEIIPQQNPKLPIVKVTTTASDIYPFIVHGIPSQVKEDGEFVVLLLHGLEEPFVFKKLVDSKLRSRATQNGRCARGTSGTHEKCTGIQK